MRALRIAVCVTGLLTALCGPVLAGNQAEEGEKDFQVLCSPCHGPTATGNGPAAAGLETPPADLTLIATRHGGIFPEELIFETIAGLDMPDAHGTRAMPVWGDVFVSEAVGESTDLEDALAASDQAARRIGNLVRFLESIQAAQ